MEKKTQFKFHLILGAGIITGVIFLVFKYLLKGPPFIKVMSVGLVIAVTYLVVDYLIKKSKK